MRTEPERPPALHPKVLRVRGLVLQATEKGRITEHLPGIMLTLNAACGVHHANIKGLSHKVPGRGRMLTLIPKL